MPRSSTLLALVAALARSASSFTLLPLGDSITYGAGSHAGPANGWVAACDETCGGYRAPLWAVLTSAGFNVTFVGSLSGGPAWAPPSALRHEGHSGWRIAQLTAILPQWSLLVPDVVLVLLGTNDIGQNHTLAEVSADMATLLSATAAALPRARVFVGTVLNMVNSKSPQWTPAVAAFNAALPAIVAKYGATLVDLAGATGMCTPDASPLQRLCSECNSASAGCVPPGAFYDRVHPTAAGYSLIAGVWAAALGHALQNATF